MFGFFILNYAVEHAKELGINISEIEKMAKESGYPISIQQKNMVIKNLKAAFPSIDVPSIGLLLACNFAIDLDTIGDQSIINMVNSRIDMYVQRYSVPVIIANCAVKMLQEKVLLDDVINKMSQNVF